MTPVETTIAKIREALHPYTWRVTKERQLQQMVMARLQHMSVRAEVSVEHGRFDVEVIDGSVRVVIELKIRGSAAAVEAQAQAYAMIYNVDAVIVATTSGRLASTLIGSGQTLGGKPFAVIALRTF